MLFNITKYEACFMNSPKFIYLIQDCSRVTLIFKSLKHVFNTFTITTLVNLFYYFYFIIKGLCLILAVNAKNGRKS